MTVNQVGRPSKTAERTAQILSATQTVVARAGIAGTTLSAVAEEAGLQRTLVLHYFGTREALMQAFIAQAVAGYGRQMLARGGRKPIGERIGLLFGGRAYRSRDELLVWSELVALAARDEGVRKQLQVLWTKWWLPELERQLAEEFTGASRQKIAGAAYAIAGLFEAHWWFHLQGLTGVNRRTQAQYAVGLILSDLNKAGVGGI